MAETFETRRELQLNVSADQAWEWLSNIRNAMTVNQFHVGLDCDPADVRDPKVGVDVPIIHEIYGKRHVRLAKITQYADYEVAWGERLPDPNVKDTFPHSEGWKVEALGPNSCLLRNRIRGRPMYPLVDVIGKALWDGRMPLILDNDLQDVAFALGAIDHKEEFELPPVVSVLHRLAQAREINGMEAKEFFDSFL